MGPRPAQPPTIWFEHICDHLGLSFFAGVLLIGSLPPDLTFFVQGYLTGMYGFTTSTGILNILNLVAFLPIPAVCLYGSRYLVRTVGDLSAYAADRSGGSAFDPGLARLGTWRFPAIATIPILIFALFIPGSRGIIVESPAGVLLTLLVAIAAFYLVFILGTLVWVFGYSMYLVSRLASQPMTLSSYGEDRYLGLRPFGRAAFRLTLVYLAALAVLAIHGNLPPLPPLFLLGYLSLFLLAIPLLLVPLRTLHRQLVNAKGGELEWIGRRCGELFSAIRSQNHPRGEEGLRVDLAALTALRQLQADVERAPTWPFDTTAATQFVAILLSVSGVLTSSIIRDVLHF